MLFTKLFNLFWNLFGIMVLISAFSAFGALWIMILFELLEYVL